MTPVVSVVIATYRRRPLLAKCLAALAAQDFPAGEFEIIVADDESSPRTEALVQQVAARSSFPLKYLAVSGTRGPAGARNAGWRAASAPAIAFTDDDCLPGRQWLRCGLDALDAGADAAWGRITMPVPERPRDHERNAARLEDAGFVTANCFCRRAALEATGGFDPRFTSAWREDSDLYFTLLQGGFRVVYQPLAVVVHPSRPASWGISLRQQRQNRFNALLYKKHPARYREHVQSAPPVPYYLMLGALAAGAGAVLTGRRAEAVVPLSLWVALYARFCYRRLAGTSHAPDHVLEMLVTSALIPPLAVFWRLAGAVRYRVLFL